MRLNQIALFALAALPLLGDTNWYDAIRDNQLSVVDELIKAGKIEEKDKHGQTPLMLAAAFGSFATMEKLIAAGADVKAKSAFDATALHFAADDLAKTKLLLQKGADVNAKSKQGRTPLMVASSMAGCAPVVRYLFEHGAVMEKGSTAELIAAVGADDIETTKLLLDRGAGVNGNNQMQITPLLSAAGAGNLALAKLLLKHGADPKFVMPENVIPPTKNGKFGVGLLSPVHFAAPYGGPEMVKLLVAAGGPVDSEDVRGITPLMAAIVTDRANPETVRTLLKLGANPDKKDKDGHSARDWARMFNNPAVLAELGMEPVAVQKVALAGSGADPRKAVEKSLTLLQASSKTFMKEGGCASCHSQNLASLAISAARQYGVKADDAAEAEHIKGVVAFLNGMSQFAMQRIGGGPGGPDGLLYSTIQLEAADVKPSKVTDTLVYSLIGMQGPDGAWHGGGMARPPMEDSDITRTALAIRAMTYYGIPGRSEDLKARTAKAANWLRFAQAYTTEDRVMRLLGMQWAGTVDRRLIGDLIASQRPDGGWGQTPFLASDAYATGQALWALHLMEIPVTDVAYERGANFLLRTQKADGSWFVPSRAPKFQPYFESGFPYGHDQWISTSATAWAATALAYTVPEQTAGLVH